MSDVSSNQMVDEIIEAVDNARNNECPQQVRKGVIDSLYWINAYQLIERYKDDLMSMGVLDDHDYIDDCCGSDWVGEVIAFETMLKRFQRKVVKVANSGMYGLTGGAEINEGNSITYSQSGTWVATDGRIGLGNVDQSVNTITVDGGVGSHRLNGNGVLEVNTVDGWVAVESNTISIGYHGQDSDDQDLMIFTRSAL